MSNADLIKRLRSENFKNLGSITETMRQAADALETAVRKDVERVHEINKLKLSMQRMERRK